MLKSFLSVFTHAEKKISNNFIWEHKTHRSTRIYEAYLSRVVSFVSLSSGRITKAPSAMVVFNSCVLSFMLHPVGSAHRYCKVYTDKGFLSCELAGVSFNFLEEQNTYNNACTYEVCLSC